MNLVLVWGRQVGQGTNGHQYQAWPAGRVLMGKDQLGETGSGWVWGTSEQGHGGCRGN